MRKNLGIIKGQYDAVPVRVYDAGELWQYQGSMRAEIEGDVATTVISWEQMTGDPVTYTSSTDGLEITFTTTDLINKVFRCYTNRGTEGERWDEGTFYHNPIDVIYNKNTLVGVTYVTGIFDPNLVTNGATGGMYYGDIVTDENPIIRFKAPVDNFTEVSFYNMPEFAIDDVLYTRVLGYTTAGGWVVLQHYDGYQGSVHSLPDTYEDFKVVVRHVKFGIITDLVVTRAELLNTTIGSGLSDRMSVGNTLTGVTSITYELQRKTNNTYVDPIPVKGTLTGVMVAEYALQSKSNMVYNDMVTSNKTLVGVTTYSYQLQTNTIVG